VAESVKTEQLIKIDFSEDLLLLKLKSAKLMKVWQQPGTYAQEIVDQKDVLKIFINFYGIAQKSVSGHLPPIRGYSWQKKMK
jgi:hypothetical protein